MLVRIADQFIATEHVIRIGSDPVSLDATLIVLDNNEVIRIENDFEWNLESIGKKIQDGQNR